MNSAATNCNWRLKFFFAVLALSCAVRGVNAAADASILVEDGRRAFESGSFSQAAGSWEKALKTFQDQRNAEGEIQTSLSLAAAYQSLGQQRRAVQLLEDAVRLAEMSEKKPQLTLAKSKLGA